MSDVQSENAEAWGPQPAPTCSHCGFTLPKHGGGLRHYGTHTAHQEAECLRNLHAEITRLRQQLGMPLETERENARLRAEVEALRADAERLDWLDGQREAYGFQDIHEGNRWLIEGPFSSLRKAVDAARKA